MKNPSMRYARKSENAANSTSNAATTRKTLAFISPPFHCTLIIFLATTMSSNRN